MDVTFIPTDEDRLYLASLIDLYNREVIGWAMGESNNTALTLSALDRALELNNPPERLIHHSDRGSNYTAGEYRQALSGRGIKISMRRERGIVGTIQWQKASLQRLRKSWFIGTNSRPDAKQLLLYLSIFKYSTTVSENTHSLGISVRYNFKE